MSDLARTDPTRAEMEPLAGSYLLAVDIEGPWKDTDVPAYIPKAHRGIFAPRDWQITALNTIETMGDRQILLVRSDGGNVGKSYLMNHLEFHQGWKVLPSTLSTANNVMRCAYGLLQGEREPKGIAMNIPNAMKQQHLWTLAQAIESLKDGKAYDERYGFKQWVFEPCPIMICTNYIPDRKIFSVDRWIIQEI